MKKRGGTRGWAVPEKQWMQRLCTPDRQMQRRWHARNKGGEVRRRNAGRQAQRAVHAHGLRGGDVFGHLGGHPLGRAAVARTHQFHGVVSYGRRCPNKHAIEGFTGAKGMMPARGGGASLTDDEVKAAVDFMADQSI